MHRPFVRELVDHERMKAVGDFVWLGKLVRVPFSALDDIVAHPVCSNLHSLSIKVLFLGPAQAVVTTEKKAAS